MSCDDEVLDPGKNIDHWYIDMKSPNQELNFAGLADLCDMVHYGEQILTIAVMAILLTAPLGKLQHISCQFLPIKNPHTVKNGHRCYY